MKIINVFEHEKLIIEEPDFSRNHWKSFVKLNDAHEGQYFDILHNGIRFKQFVGVIQIDNLLVQIHPKADKDDSNKKWRGVLLKMLKACGHIKAETAGNANLNKQHLNLLQVYFEYFLNEIESLIHQGLVKKYHNETGIIKSLKGKLDFAGNIRHNLVHKERFYTTHQVYDTNHLIHQVLSYALEIVEYFSRGSTLNDKCKRVKFSFPETSYKKINSSLLDNLKLDRKTANYERAIELAKLIILNFSPDINEGRNKMIALLFDMNQLWEEYVLVMLKKALKSEESKIQQFSINGQVTTSFWRNNTLVPDIVLKKGNQKIVIDTKWKRPGYSASVEDLRQIYTYARFLDASKVMLLYPGDSSQNKIGIFKTDDYIKLNNSINEGVRIEHFGMMGFVSVLADEGKLDDKLGDKVLKMLEIN
jgi:5-methylcytosine-specific restriction enzyme subunit McrC